MSLPELTIDGVLRRDRTGVEREYLECRKLYSCLGYLVAVDEFDLPDLPGMLHIEVWDGEGRVGTEPSWAMKQRIKNMVAGEERVAVEVFPAESELVDNVDAYHLWVYPEGYRLPFRLIHEGE